jgi:pilus assembly protein CpaB
MLPNGAVNTVEAAADRTAAGPIFAGEPILESKLAAKGSRGGMAWLIPQGMRAYTIQASRAASSVAGFILPGNKVDVLLNLRSNSNDENGGGRTITLLQAVEILAVDQNLDAPAENKVNPKDLGSVTLLVAPDQAGKLDLGQNQGQLSLSLRNPEDAGAGPTASVTVNNILPERPVPKPQTASCAASMPVEPPRVEVVTLRGMHRGVILLRPRPE